MTTTQQRYAGALLGLAVGDAIGTTVEFKPRGSFQPVTDMTGGGVFGLKAGEWTDDTSMALCLAASLIESRGFDLFDQLDRYTRWWRDGYMSSNGRCFDIGSTTISALRRFEETGGLFSEISPKASGNGALMRLAPIPMVYAGDDLLRYAKASTMITHNSVEAVECSQLFATILRAALTDTPITTKLKFTSAKVAAIARGEYKRKSSVDIHSDGYCVHSLEAALWCVYRTTTFNEAVLLAANLGHDADTVAAITGQIAGAFYGVNAIRADWSAKIVMRELILAMADALYEKSHGTSKNSGII